MGRVILCIGRAAVIFVVILKILSNYSKFTGMGRCEFGIRWGVEKLERLLGMGWKWFGKGLHDR